MTKPKPISVQDKINLILNKNNIDISRMYLLYKEYKLRTLVNVGIKTENTIIEYFKQKKNQISNTTINDTTINDTTINDTTINDTINDTTINDTINQQENNIFSDTTRLSSKKYKTIGDLKKASKRSMMAVISRMNESKEKDYLCKWVFEIYYLNQFSGNLTNRIKKLNNLLCNNYITNHCFDGKNPLKTCKTNIIINDHCKNVIQSLYTIDPSLTGIYMDYLIRRIMSELKQKTFEDSRADRITNLKNLQFSQESTDKPHWKFISLPKYKINSWVIYFEPNINSKEIGILLNSYIFIELERKNEWLKIKSKDSKDFIGCIGWVRYLLPNVLNNPKGIYGNFSEYVPNKWFIQIDNNELIKNYNDCCGNCKMGVDELLFPYCQNICYTKVTNTEKYKTKDILKELFIVSICHCESFGSSPSQESFDKIYKILNNIDISDFIGPLVNLCETIIGKSENILLNPALGGDKVYNIPSDCDIVIDDNLIDIKCTKKDNTIYEILQLLGYSSLLKYNENYKLRINKISVLNLLKGEYKVINIDNISDDNLLKYLQILTNK